MLYEFLDRFVVVYPDDFVVYSETFSEHAFHFRQVFSWLKEYKLYVKKEKCEFYLHEVKFLGHWVSKGQIQMDEAITYWLFSNQGGLSHIFFGVGELLHEVYKEVLKEGEAFDKLVEERS